MYVCVYIYIYNVTFHYISFILHHAIIQFYSIILYYVLFCYIILGYTMLYYIVLCVGLGFRV